MGAQVTPARAARMLARAGLPFDAHLQDPRDVRHIKHGQAAILNFANVVFEPSFFDQMPNIVEPAGGQVVQNNHFLALFHQMIGKVTADKSRSARN